MKTFFAAVFVSWMTFIILLAMVGITKLLWAVVFL